MGAARFSVGIMASRLALAAMLASGAVHSLPAAAQEIPNEPGAATNPTDVGVVVDDIRSDEGVIIVTARRREESLVDVPIAVTAYSGESLLQAGAFDITDIAQTTPNTTLEASRGTNSTLTAFIRGVGQQDPVSGFEQGVGIYLDDVYLNRPQAAVLEIYDLERIEVLRGPQGTLYGRNTIGGAVKYVTRPLAQDFAFNARVNVGTYDQLDGIVSVSAPVNDLIRVGGAVARLTRDGFGENLTTGEDNYDKDIWAGRASLDIGGFGEPVTIRINADYTKDESSARGGTRLIPGLLSGAPVLDDVYDTRGGLVDPEQDVEAYGLSMNIAIDLSDTLTFRSISGWRKDDSASPIDFDALAAVDVDVPAFYRNEQLSQELQLLYESDRLSGLVGFYYLDATADTQFDVRLFTTLNGLTAFTEANVDTETYAVFGDFTFDLTEQLSFSVGGRYTWDERSAEILRQNYLGGGSPVFGGTGVIAGAPGTDFSGSRDFNKFTPRASVSFQPTPDHNFYASYSQGFKGGGFDPRGVGTNAPAAIPGQPTDEEVTAFLSFRPESVDSYEIGYKGNLMDGAVYVALAGFYADYTDVQIPGSVGCTTFVSPGPGLPPEPVQSFCGIVSNAGAATFKGVEFEGNARLGRDLMAAGDRLTLAVSGGYIDAQYDEFVTNILGQPTDVAEFREVQNTPEFTGSATLGYETPVGEGDLNFTTTVSYRSKTYQFEIPSPFLDQDGFALFDANLVYTAPGRRWSLGLHGRNLLDKQYKTSGYSFIAADPVTGEPVRAGPGGFPRPTSCQRVPVPAGSVIPSLGCEGTLTAFYGNPRQVFVTATFRY